MGRGTDTSGVGRETRAPTEAQEQEAVVEFCDWAGVPVFHIPNGGYRHKHTAYQMKRQGVKAGVPDLFVPVASDGCHGLFVEMKRAKGGTVSADQEKWLCLLRDNGYAAEVCHGADEAIGAIRAYLGR